MEMSEGVTNDPRFEPNDGKNIDAIEGSLGEMNL